MCARRGKHQIPGQGESSSDTSFRPGALLGAAPWTDRTGGAECRQGAALAGFARAGSELGTDLASPSVSPVSPNYKIRANSFQPLYFRVSRSNDKIIVLIP